MNHLLVLSVLLALCSGGLAHWQAKCLPPMGKIPFDTDKFSGEWYAVAKIESKLIPVPPVPATCHKITYKATEDGNTTRVKLELVTKVEGKDVKYISTGQAVHHKMTSVTQNAWKKETDDKWMSVISQSVLATDYTSFALWYACKPMYLESTDTFDKMEVIQIWSRAATIDSTLFDVLKNVLSSYSFDVADMKAVDNSKC